MNQSPPRESSEGFQYPHLLRLLHWVLTVSLGILLLTGLSLHAASRPEWSVFSGVVPPGFWKGRVYIWHYWAAVAFFPAVLGYLPFCLRKAFWSRSTHVTLIFGGIIAALTGLWMMFPLGSREVLKTVTAVHAAFGLVVLPLGFFWHVFRGLTRYWRWIVPSFRPLKDPRWGQVGVFALVALITTWVLFEGWPLHPPWRDLVAPRIERVSSAPADPSGLPWDRAEPVTLRLLNGAGFSSGHTDLTLQALHDGKDLYLKASWEDPSADRSYVPWRRVEDGWEYLQTSAKDETVHYEDKFSMIFPIERSWLFDQTGCALYCHIDGEYAYGYKGGKPDVDVWHWKSVRTDPVGQVDDKYWSVVDLEAKDVGRHGDPSTGGGYTKNVSEDGSKPLFLPGGPDAIRKGAILRERAVEYTTERADEIPVEAIIPGIVCSPVEGDRGDVACTSTHRQDRWTLYIRRRLDTESPHDVKFIPGKATSFGCAAFDHAAKRHAYSMPTYRLVLEP